ncbi:winged helix-turn-helix domain-containing protein [Streptomyces sp. NPDC001652]|uniref:winged helix-turn-helix domain-containing protein n=1 Tax=Streptomyces sp. NPDC001652 TaxID=3154393 RepID=UPI00332BE85D
MDAQQASDGGGKEFRRVADELRTRMVNGTYPLQSYLPAQRVLAEEFGVSRDTVQRVLRELVAEGWVAPKQGSGTRVIKTQQIQPTEPKMTGLRRGATLGDIISQAFEQPEVTLDVYTLTSESLDTHIRLQAERIHAGIIAPQRIRLRLLLPDDAQPLPYPRAKHDADDLRPLERLRAITRRHTASLRGTLKDLQTVKLVPSVDVQIRRAQLTPAFKLYLLNGTEVLYGMYEVVERPIELDTGEVIDSLDVLGLGATLIHYVKDVDPDSPGAVFVDRAEVWFESVWEHLGRE